MLVNAGVECTLLVESKRFPVRPGLSVSCKGPKTLAIALAAPSERNDPGT